MSFRLWYPQLDVYDAIRRFACLLSRQQGKEISLERLYIQDFFFANPPLLHRIHMPREVRNEFDKLHVPRPDRAFLSYPSAPILFHKMEPIQKEALRTLVGKGLLDRDRLAGGQVQPSPKGTTLLRDSLSNLLTETERPILQFMAQHFANISPNDISTLRRSTGLRRIS